jgi:hypothetical protein
MTELAPSAPTTSDSPGDVPRAERNTANPDRVTVLLLSCTAFLLVLALLGSQLGGSAGAPARRGSIVVRRIYRTTVLERVLPAGAGPRDGASVTQSSSAAPVTEAGPVVPVTRAS